MFKNIIATTILSLSIALASFSSNAALITQTILFDDLSTTEVESEVIGTLTINTEDNDGTGHVTKWESFELFGFDMLTESEANLIDPLLFGGFIAGFDSSDLTAGIDFAQFDVTESDFGFFAFSGLVDQVGSGYFIDVFDFGGGLYAFGAATFGSVSVVPEPGAIALLLTGLLALRIRKSA